MKTRSPSNWLAVLLALPLSLICAQEAAPVRIAAGFSIRLTLKGFPADEARRFNGLYPLSPAGDIALPCLSAPIHAVGLTPAELGHAIESAYIAADIYKAPKFDVAIGSPAAGEESIVTVGGRVVRPGPMKYSPGMTVSQAIEAAGGIATPERALKRISLIHQGKCTELDLTKDPGKNTTLLPDDTIEVPDASCFGQ